MSDDSADSLQRRTVLKNAAMTVGGIVAVSGGASATDLSGVVRTQGDLTPAEAIEKLRQVDDWDGTAIAQSDCYTETKCGDGCVGEGEVFARTCCPNVEGCGECCDSWEGTGNCC